MTQDLLLNLYQRQQTVFTLKEISQMETRIAYKNLKRKLSYFVSVGKLERLRQGIYVKKEFNFWEAANKIYAPSYISLESVLAKEGVIFQKYQTIFAVSYLTRKIKIGNQEIFYRKLRPETLLNNSGVEKTEEVYVAVKERAFLDAVYIYKNYHFDNLAPLDWEKVRELVKIYASPVLEKRAESYEDDWRRNA